MFCPSCGNTIAEGSSFCMNCGKAIPAVSVAPRHSTRSRSFSDIPICPKCQQVDAVRKVSSILSTDVATGSVPTVRHASLAGHNFEATVYQQTVSSTLRAQELRPLPNEDIYEKSALYLSRPLPKGFPTSEKGSINRFGSLGMEISVEQRLRTSLYKVRREKLHHCGRCDVVFIPGESRFEQISNLDDLLFAITEALREEDICCITSICLPGFWFLTYHVIAGSIGTKGYTTVAISSVKPGFFGSSEKVKKAAMHLAQQLEEDDWQPIPLDGINGYYARQENALFHYTLLFRRRRA